MIQHFFHQAIALIEHIFAFDNYKILHGIALFHGCIDGFLGKKEYAAIPETKFTKKLQQLLCLECSIWHIFLRKSFTDSITARFLRSILSESLIRLLVLAFFFCFVTSCMPFSQSLPVNFWEI